MKTKIFRILSLLLALSISACAPGLNTSLRVSQIPVSEDAPLNLSGLKIRIDSFEDMRSTSSIAKVDGREVRAEGNVGLSVQQAVERQIKIQGARLSLFNTPSIKGTVREWRIVVKPDFPSSKANAKAAISIDLMDTEGKKIYSGNYAGNMSVENPLLLQDKVEGILGEAMLNAINRFLNDPKFISKLREASSRIKPDSKSVGSFEAESPEIVEQPAAEETLPSSAWTRDSSIDL